jgi:hypothetical protein
VIAEGGKFMLSSGKNAFTTNCKVLQDEKTADGRLVSAFQFILVCSQSAKSEGCH